MTLAQGLLKVLAKLFLEPHYSLKHFHFELLPSLSPLLRVRATSLSNGYLWVFPGSCTLSLIDVFCKKFLTFNPVLESDFLRIWTDIRGWRMRELLTQYHFYAASAMGGSIWPWPTSHNDPHILTLWPLRVSQCRLAPRSQATWFASTTDIAN